MSSHADIPTIAQDIQDLVAQLAARRTELREIVVEYTKSAIGRPGGAQTIQAHVDPGRVDAEIAGLMVAYGMTEMLMHRPPRPVYDFPALWAKRLHAFEKAQTDPPAKRVAHPSEKRLPPWARPAS